MEEILGWGYGEEDWYEGELTPGNGFATLRTTDGKSGPTDTDDGK